MFHPTANRLAGFLEISALSMSLAQTGGAQAKAGYLRIDASGSKGGGFGRKSARWAEKKKTRWCAVRESYLVVLEEPGEVSDFVCRNSTCAERMGTSSRYGMSSYWTLTLKSSGRLDTIAKASI